MTKLFNTYNFRSGPSTYELKRWPPILKPPTSLPKSPSHQSKPRHPASISNLESLSEIIKIIKMVKLSRPHNEKVKHNEQSKIYHKFSIILKPLKSLFPPQTVTKKFKSVGKRALYKKHKNLKILTCFLRLCSSLTEDFACHDTGQDSQSQAGSDDSDKAVVVVIVEQHHGVSRDTMLLISHAYSLLTLTQCYQDDPRGCGGSGVQQVFKEEKKINLWRTSVFICMSSSDHIIIVEKDLKDYLLFMYLPMCNDVFWAVFAIIGANYLGEEEKPVLKCVKFFSR